MKTFVVGNIVKIVAEKLSPTKSRIGKLGIILFVYHKKNTNTLEKYPYKVSFLDEVSSYRLRPSRYFQRNFITNYAYFSADEIIFISEKVNSIEELNSLREKE